MGVIDFNYTEGTEDDNEAVEEVEKEDETEDADIEAQDAVKNSPFGGVVIGMGTDAEVDDGGKPEENEEEGDEHGGMGKMIKSFCV